MNYVLRKGHKNEEDVRVNVNQLIKSTASITLTSESEVQKNIVVFLDCMEKALLQGETITLPLFGTFKKVAITKGNSLQSKIVFKPSSNLNKRIKENMNIL